MEPIFAIFRYIMLGLIVITFVAMIGMWAGRQVDILDEETYIISQRLIRSGSCLAFEDERVYQGIIDLSKFEKSRMENCVVLTGDKGFFVDLSYLDEEIQSFVVNDRINVYHGLCDVERKYGFKCSSRQDYVLIKDGEVIKPGYLTLEVIDIE